MPHLSPMSWVVVMPMMWMIIVLLATMSYTTQSPHFYTIQVNKSLQMNNSWSWTLQGGRD